MATNHTALNISQIQQVKNIIEPDLLVLASGITFNDLDYLGINVVTGIENKTTRVIYETNGSVARAYVPGNALKRSTLGKGLERVLEVKPVVSRVYDNIRIYAEKIGFTTVGISDDGVLNCPTSQKNMEILARAFGRQNMLNVFLGERNETLAGSTPYSCFDGIMKKAKNDITAGIVSVAKGNLQGVDEIELSDTSDEAKVGAYEEFDKAFLNLDEDLQDADEINVAMSSKLAQYIMQGAAIKFNGSGQLPIMTSGKETSMTFFDRPNLHLKPTRLMGRGQDMIFYTPGTLEFGTDLSNSDPSAAFIDVMQNPDDFNELIYQMQVSLGTRVLQYDSANFCAVGKATTANNETTISFTNVGKTLTEGVDL